MRESMTKMSDSDENMPPLIGENNEGRLTFKSDNTDTSNLMQ